jgi:hypothetical protein
MDEAKKEGRHPTCHEEVGEGQEAVAQNDDANEGQNAQTEAEKVDEGGVGQGSDFVGVPDR